MILSLTKDVDLADYGEWIQADSRTCFSLTWRYPFLHKIEVDFSKRSYRKPPACYFKTTHYYLKLNPITWLRRCDCCGKLGTPKRINYGYFRFSPDRAGRANYDSRYGEFCISCKNKLRVIQNKSLDFHYTRRLINNYNKEIKNGRKNQNNGAA